MLLIRSPIFIPAAGGLACALISELLFGAPSSFTKTILVGCCSGLGIALAIAIRDLTFGGRTTDLNRKLAFAAICGLAGGGVGVFFGNAIFRSLGSTYQVSKGHHTSDLSVFSSDMRDRLQEAGAKHGTVQFSLSWENKSDLDLHVIDPSGYHIFFGNIRSPSGGELDIDRNVSLLEATNKPIEHIVWPEDSGPEGDYRVAVHLYDNRVGYGSEFRIETLIDGEVKEFKGRVSTSQPLTEVATLKRSPPQPISPAPPWRAILARIIGWGVFGALVGMVQGVVRGSWPIARSALLGGAIGGATGGLAFELLARMSGESALGQSIGRVLGLTILGAAVGWFSILVTRALSAFLQVTNGQYKGRELFIDRAVFGIGRDELIPGYLKGDPQIERRHAEVKFSAGQYSVSALDGAIQVNGKAGNTLPLNDGDLLQVGSTVLRFFKRGSTAKRLGDAPLPSTNSEAAPKPFTISSVPPPPPSKAKEVSGGLPKANPPPSLNAPEKKPDTTSPKPPPPPPMKPTKT
jgi:hypothetical protein